MVNTKYFVQCSTGKDSEASVWWAYHNLPFESWEIIFCDVDWDNKAVYEHLKYLESRTGKKAIVLKSKGFKDKISKEVQEKIIEIFGEENVFAEMVIAKTRFPSTKKRFCTEVLKTTPTVDFILDHVKSDCVMIQGVRAEESLARRFLSEKDDYFKFYVEPYGYDKNKKPKYHTYRKKEVLEYIEKYDCQVLRPIIKLSANDVFNIIFENNSPANKLYSQGSKRVGCFPCIMCSLSEIKQIIKIEPKKLEQLEQLEQLVNSTFFPPGYIPERFCSKKAKVNVYPDDLIRLFGIKEKKSKKNKDQSLIFELEQSKNPEKILFERFFRNEKIPVYLDEDGDEYIVRVVKVPTIPDVVKYVSENPNQVDLIPMSSGCVSVYNICDSPK